MSSETSSFRVVADMEDPIASIRRCERTIRVLMCDEELSSVESTSPVADALWIVADTLHRAADDLDNGQRFLFHQLHPGAERLEREAGFAPEDAQSKK